MILWEETEIDGIFAEVHPDPDIKGNDTLRGDGNNPDDNTNRTLFNDKRKWYSERRRKYCNIFNFVFCNINNIKGNDTLRGDGNSKYRLS